LSSNHYFIKYFTLVYSKNVVIVTLSTSIMFLILICMYFWVWGVLRRWFACAPTAYEVVRDCRTFEKHCIRPVFVGWFSKVSKSTTEVIQRQILWMFTTNRGACKMKQP
jgi:hypothetical protein